jgi:antitoxin component YwqK of YwqJK toxin-antitoxin module
MVKLTNMLLIIGCACVFSLGANAQLKDYKIAGNGDTLNRVDMNGLKQGPWVIRIESVRGEPGYEEEGQFQNGRKEGEWRMFNLMGDLVGVENYRWGLKDGQARYLNPDGTVRLEQSWKALNPDKVYDTIQVEDLDKLDSYHEVIIKNEGAALKHGTWRYYDPQTGRVSRTENYELGKLKTEDAQAMTEEPVKKAVPKPKEVLEFEKKNAGKKKVKFKDGSTN